MEEYKLIEFLHMLLLLTHAELLPKLDAYYSYLVCEALLLFHFHRILRNHHPHIVLYNILPYYQSHKYIHDGICYQTICILLCLLNTFIAFVAPLVILLSHSYNYLEPLWWIASRYYLTPSTDIVYNVYCIWSKEVLVSYFHQAAGYPMNKT